MKTAISLPEPIFRRAERAARRLKVSRSDLYRRALEAYLSSLDAKEVTASYDAAYAESESGAEERFRRRAARTVLASSEWDS